MMPYSAEGTSGLAVRELSSCGCARRLAQSLLASIVLGFVSLLCGEMTSAGAATIVNSNVSSTTTWSSGGSPYLVSGNVIVSSGVVLTISSGVVVKFESGAGLRVDGTLDVNGSSGSKVVFTSIGDDAADSLDSGSDGATHGEPGDWNSIVFMNSGSSTIDHAIVRYGGYGNSARYGQLKVEEAQLTITDSVVERGLCSGLAVDPNRRLIATRIKVWANGLGCGSTTGNGIDSSAGYTTITDSAIVENAGYGVVMTVSNAYSAGSPPTLGDSLIWWNGKAGVKLESQTGTSSSLAPDGSGNNIFDNGVDASFADRMLQIETEHMPGADWTDNYWGEPVDEEACPTGRCHGGNAPRTHLSYRISVPDGNWPNHTLGPIQADHDKWELHHPVYCDPPFWYGQPDGVRWISGVCLPNQDLGQASADNVDGASPSLFPFPNDVMTVPQPIGLPTVRALMGGDYVPVQHSTAGGRRTSVDVNDPVNSATGSLTETLTDVSLAGPGAPFEWTRSYNSRDATSGRLGVGWVDVYDASLTIDGGGNVTYRSGAGQEIEFATRGDGTFVTRSFAGTLTKTGGGDYLLVTQDQRAFEFSSSGQLTSIKPRNLPATTLHYTSTKLTSITDSAGRTITITYKLATPSLIDRVTLPDARYVEFGYDSGRLMTVRDTRGETWNYHYDANDYLDEIQNPEGEYPLRNTYDADGRVLTQTDGEGALTTFAYSSTPDNLGFDLTTVTVPDRGSTVYRYSALILHDVTDPLGNRTRYAYDRNFRPTSVVDARGKTQSFEYDANGNMTSEADADEKAIVRTFNASNQLLTEEDRREHTTTYAYCNTSTCSAHGNSYLEGQLQSITNRESGQRIFEYIQAGIGVAAPTVGQVASLTDERGKVTSYEYDSAGNLAMITSPRGFETTMTYDASGRLETQRDARGNVPVPPAGFLTTWTYEAGDEVASVVSPTRTVSYVYDDAGRLAEKTTPDGDWSYTYDDAGRVVSITDPKLGIERFAFDEAGGLIEHETPGGAITTYTYDDAGRLATKRDPLGNVAGASPTDESDHTWTYGYDAVGNITSLAHPDAGTQYTEYNDVNLPVEWTDARSKVTQAGYDENYNLTSRTNADADDDDDEIYTYDDLDRLETTTNRNGNTTTLTYFETGQRESLTTETGSVRTWSLDDDGRVDAMVEPRGNEFGAIAADYTWEYDYDEVGNLVTVTDPLTNDTERTYDAANNLTSLTDARGNTTSYTIDAMDRVTEVTPPAAGASSPLATTNTYDELGRLTERTDPNGHSTTASYDADGLVTRSATAATTTDYTYDANHNLVLQESRPTSGQSAEYEIAPSDPLSPPILDEFNRSDEGPPLSSAWDEEVRPGDAGADVDNDEATGASGRWSALWHRETATDQDVRARLDTLMGNGNAAYLFARIQDADSTSVTGYALTLTQNTTVGSDSWAITRINSSSSTTTLTTNATGASASAGLEVRFLVTGSTLTGYALVGGAWVQQVQTTDATYAPAASLTGLGGDGASGGLDDFRSAEYTATAPLLDDFNRANTGPPPSGSWGGIVFDNDAAVSVDGNQARGGNGPPWSQLWGQTFGPDQDASITMGTLMGSGNETFLFARVTGEGGASVRGYELAVFQSAGSGRDYWRIRRIDEGQKTQLATNEHGAELATGMQVRFVVRGSQLIGYALVDGVWVEQVQTADKTHEPAVSRVGIGGHWATGSIDDFHAGVVMPEPRLRDNFNRSNEGPPPSNDWGPVVSVGDAAAEVTSNTASGDTGTWSQLWDTLLASDQDVEVTISTPAGSSNYTHLYARIEHPDSAQTSGYQLQLHQDATGGTDAWSIRRIDDGSITSLATNSTGQIASAGLRMRLVARASLLIGYALVGGVWVEQVHATDTHYAPLNSGAGLGASGSAARLDDFRASETARQAPLLDSFDRDGTGSPPSDRWGGVALENDYPMQVYSKQAYGEEIQWSQVWGATYWT